MTVQTSERHAAFKLLDETTSAHIAAELEHPDSNPRIGRAVASATVRKIAGLEVVDAESARAKRDAEVGKRQNELLAYVKHRAHLDQLLAKAGVPILGGTRSSLWEKMRREAKLYHLRPDASGTVQVRTSRTVSDIRNTVRDVMQRRIDRLKKMRKSVYIVLPVVGAGIQFSLLHHPGALALGASVGLAAAVLSHMTISEFMIARYQRTSWTTELNERMLEKLTRRSIEKLGANRDALLRALMPDYCESAAGKRIAIELPTPPADVQQTLLRLDKAGLKPEVYAVGEAITFREDPVKVLNEEHQRIVEEERIEAERRARAAADPIIAVQYETAIVFVAQYGDFPIERQLIERIVREDHLA